MIFAWHILTLISFIGTQRRVQKKTQSNKEASVTTDKRITAAIKKFGKYPSTESHQVYSHGVFLL